MGQGRGAHPQHPLGSSEQHQQPPREQQFGFKYTQSISQWSPQQKFPVEQPQSASPLAMGARLVPHTEQGHPRQRQTGITLVSHLPPVHPSHDARGLRAWSPACHGCSSLQRGTRCFKTDSSSCTGRSPVPAPGSEMADGNSDAVNLFLPGGHRRVKLAQGTIFFQEESVLPTQGHFFFETSLSFIHEKICS